MSITNELREIIPEIDFATNRDRLRAIADRIDEQCERELTMARGEAVQHLGSEVAKKYVKLPVDADGEPIHLQDRMSWDNGTFNVHELNLTADGWTTWDELHGYTVRADQCHHVKPDSWERIIEDVRRRTSDYYCNQIPCDFRKMADEMVERCKKLAGEDA